MNKTQSLIRLSLFFILISSCCLSTVCAAEEVILPDGSVIYVEPLYEDINSLPPGKEIGKEIIVTDIFDNEHVVKDFYYYYGKAVSDLYLLFVDTPFRKIAYYAYLIILTLTLSAGGLFFVLFRFAPKEKKKSDTREKILNYIQYNPGSQEKDIVSDLKISRGSVSYQLLKLKAEKKIYSDSSLGQKRYFPCSVKPDTLKGKLYAVSKNQNCAKILNLLSENENLKRNDIAELMEMPQSAVYRYLKILLINDLIIKRNNGREVFYSLTEEVKSQLK